MKTKICRMLIKTHIELIDLPREKRRMSSQMEAPIPTFAAVSAASMNYWYYSSVV